jgi:hypothetical protein
MKPILFLLAVFAGFYSAAANAQNTTPRGYIKPLVKTIGNNPEFSTETLVENGRNFGAQENPKITRKRDRKERRRERARRQSQSTQTRGVNE